MFFKVLDPVLPQPAFSTAYQPLNEVLRFFRDVGDMGRELKSLLGRKGQQRTVRKT